MSTAGIIGLGAIAGFTIFLGLPLGRLPRRDTRVLAGLAAFAIGILLFLLWDVLVHAVEPVEERLDLAVDGEGSWAGFIARAVVVAASTALGLLSLVLYDRWMSRRRARAPIGPGAAAVAEFAEGRSGQLTAAQLLAVLIATGIGLHNFAEGLAIGQSAASDEITLALMLVIGFGLHNATEGFGIIAPLTGDAQKPSWGFLLLLGVIGGSPTFFGTIVGQAWTSEMLSLVFFGLAAGSILYVVIELFALVRGAAPKLLTSSALLVGLLLGFATDFVLEAAGG